MCLLQLFEVDVKLLQPSIFIALAFIAGSTGRKIGIDQSQIPEIELDHPALFVAYGMPRTIFDVIRFYFGEYGNAAISFFPGGEPIIVEAQLREQCMSYIVFMCFSLLYADDIGG